MRRFRPALALAIAGVLGTTSVVSPMAAAAGDRRLALAYYYFNAQEKEVYCIANAPQLEPGACDGDLALAMVETHEEFRLEDGTFVAATSSYHADVTGVNSSQSSFVDGATETVVTGVAGAVGWQIGYAIGTAVKPLLQAAVVNLGGGTIWAMLLGGAAPWIGGMVLAGGALY
jgi:hypothetical protein